MRSARLSPLRSLAGHHSEVINLSPPHIQGGFVQDVGDTEKMIDSITNADTDTLTRKLNMETSMKHSHLSIIHALQGLAALLQANGETNASKHILSAATILSQTSQAETAMLAEALIEEAGTLPGKKPEINVHLLSSFCHKHTHGPHALSRPDVLLVHNFCKEIMQARKSMNQAYYDRLDDALSSLKQYAPVDPTQRYLAAIAAGAAAHSTGYFVPLVGTAAVANAFYNHASANKPLNRKNRDAYHKLLQTGAPIDLNAEMSLAEK